MKCHDGLQSRHRTEVSACQHQGGLRQLHSVGKGDNHQYYKMVTVGPRLLRQ